MPTTDPPTAKQIEQLILFRDSADVPSFNRSLRNFLLRDMASKKYYDFDRGDFIIDMIKLFHLLDALEEVTKE